MVAQKFPKGHPNAGQDTEFPLAIKYYDKIHTIRANYALWEKRFRKIAAGEAVLSLRIWADKPYMSKQLEIFRYDRTHGIGLEKLALETYKVDDDGIWYADLISGSFLKDLAKHDGLSVVDFKDWFAKVSKLEPFAIIHFTSFRYGL